jgi:anion-transporting  ArsA/GET3 family ATPase
MKPATLDLKGGRLLVCLGPGGVGKTTLSAALAVRAAMDGRSVDVMTVDPAPRLLNALGLDPTSAEPQAVELKRAGGDDGAKGRRTGRLRALKLDPKHTFDTLVVRYAPSDAACDVILQNRIYHNLSNALSGVADYMAMEKLLELCCDAAADLVVLDTPPAGDALDFLDAPRRLLELLNSRALALLGRPRGLMRGGFKLVDATARAVLSMFDHVTGLHLLADVHAFVASFEGMYGGFAERAEQAFKLLRAPETMIVVVTTPEGARTEQVGRFVSTLETAGLKVGAIVVNRVTPAIPDLDELRRAELPSPLKRKLVRNAMDFAALKARETRALKRLLSEIGTGRQVLCAPELEREPRSLAELAALARRVEPLKI